MGETSKNNKMWAPASPTISSLSMEKLLIKILMLQLAVEIEHFTFSFLSESLQYQCQMCFQGGVPSINGYSAKSLLI